MAVPRLAYDHFVTGDGMGEGRFDVRMTVVLSHMTLQQSIRASSIRVFVPPADRDR